MRAAVFEIYFNIILLKILPPEASEFFFKILLTDTSKPAVLGMFWPS
jgi:hypothetical protein